MGREGQYGEEEAMRLKMFAEAAEKTRKGTDGKTVGGVPSAGLRAGAKTASRQRGAKPALVMEEIAHVANLKEAFEEVAAN